MTRFCPTCGNPIIVTIEEEEWLYNDGKPRVILPDETIIFWDRLLTGAEMEWISRATLEELTKYAEDNEGMIIKEMGRGER